MYFARIEFPTAADQMNADVEAILEGLLNAWQINGHINGRNISLMKSPQGFTAFAAITASDALDKTRFSEFVKYKIEQWEQAGGADFSYLILGHNLEKSVCQCVASSSFFLIASSFTAASPLHCSDCSRPVAFYRVAPNSQHNLAWWCLWEKDYRACHSIESRRAILQNPVIKQLSHLDSGLTQNGLEVCRKIKGFTSRDTYYYLYQGYGRSLTTEKNRLCPQCNGSWLLEHAWHDQFDFKCDNCHLLSNVAYNVREGD